MTLTNKTRGMHCLNGDYRPLVDGHPPRRMLRSAPLPFDVAPRVVIERLLGILQNPGRLSTHEVDLALVMALGARDYITSSGGASVRNVMSASQAMVGGHLRLGSIQEHHDFSALIEGRRFFAIAHGEGEAAHLTLIENDRWDENFDKTPMVWKGSSRSKRLFPGCLRSLFESPHDRIILGPHVLYRTHNITAGPAYHEIQSGDDSGLHAINALNGETCITRAAFQSWLINERRHAGADEDRFYINPAPRDPVMPFFQIDGPVPPPSMAGIMRAYLNGQVESSEPGATPEDLITLAHSWEGSKDGIIVFAEKRYVALKKVFNPYDRINVWVLIDSHKDHQEARWPSHHLKTLSSLEGCMLFGWSEHTPFDRIRLACSVQ